MPVNTLIFVSTKVVLGGEFPSIHKNIFLHALYSTEKSFATEIEEWVISSVAAAPALCLHRQWNGSLRHADRNWENQFPAYVNLAEFCPGLLFKTSDPRLSSGIAEETNFADGSQALPPLMGALYFSILIRHRIKTLEEWGKSCSFPCPPLKCG